MRVVALDTAGPVVGVAATDGTRVAVRTAASAREVEALLLGWVGEVTAELGFEIPDLQGVAVAVGPGAFTGLRIGLATGIGLALARGVPLWPCSSLATRATRPGVCGDVLAVLDARKGRVYALHVRDSAVVRGPEDVPPEEAAAWIDGPYLVTGEGALAYRAVFDAAGAVLAPEPDDPAVDTLARLGSEAIAAGQGQAAVSVVPVYVRPPDAKLPSRPRGGGS